MAFSPFGILAVLFELLRPALPLLIIVLGAVMLCLLIALRAQNLGHARALRLSLLSGVVMAVAAIILGPWITQASFADLSGAVDWLSLIGGAMAVGVVTTLLLIPPLSVLTPKTRT